MHRSGGWRGTAALTALILAACAPPPAGLQPAPGRTVAAITADDLRLRVGILAHDSLAGRETGRPGAAATARYLAAEMARLGLAPAGDDGGYLQRVPLERRRPQVGFSIETPTGVAFLGPDELLPISGLSGLTGATRQSGGGQLVYAGYLVDPVVGANELDLEQLREAVVIIRLGIPADVDPDEVLTPRLPVASVFGPTSPVAAVLIVAEEGEQELWAYAAEAAARGAVGLPTDPSREPLAAPFFLIGSETAERLIGSSLAEARLPRVDLGFVRFSSQDEIESIEAWNVAAVLPGSDPTLASEFVGLGGHYDHVGAGEPVNGDSIYNGADDNASGTSALLEVAERFASLPADLRPARSLLFVWKTAEESGLLGSQYFTDHPTVPRGAIVAHVNLDMVSRNHPDSLFVVGASRLSTELGTVVEEVNRELPRPFVLDYSYDALGHPEQLYCRSDHYNYARYGIPIVFFTSGLHRDYHAPSDEPGRLDYDKLSRVGDLVYRLTLELGDRPTRPRVDQPLPPPGAPCS